ncbi:MAG: multicopper oxidase family protein [Gemmatimonadetes bacterium]|nr:multicopper oxidase family protein [Gemmatimonadota bacterium]
MTDRGCVALRRITRSFAATLLAVTIAPSAATGQERPNQTARNGRTLEWRMPVPPIQMPMLPGMMAYRPPMTPFLPGIGVDPSSLPVARPREVVNLADGDTLDLAAILVRRVINGKTFVMYGFNGQYPGPLIVVKQSATVVVNFTNRIDLPTTIHWHGVRLDNRFDGVPGVTQDPVLPGESFVYQIHFPDPGIYWYHPHVREDIQQELGLYGNMLVESPDPDYYNPVNREEVLILDDLFMDREEIVPFGEEAGNFSLMGRFGNLFLLNGEPDYHLNVKRGEVVRFLLTNVSNTRSYNVVFGDARMKVVGADISKFQREEWVESVFIAPAQRYVIEARFDTPGEFAITNNVQAINHVRGEFFASVDTLGTITVSDDPAEANYAGQFLVLRENEDVIADIERFRPHFDRPPDHELVLTLRLGEVPSIVVQFMSIDTTYFPPVEMNNAMPMMNWVSNAGNVRWILREPATRRENMDIDWEFTQGDVVKIRLFNDPNSIHPMGHPIHLHGQRLLVLERDGVRTRNLAWKDTAMIPTGSTVDLLVEMSNPGRWMMHCHIAEHLEAGMMTAFTVTPSDARN